MINLLDFNQAQLAEYFVGLGEKPFRAKQLMRWIHHFGVSDVEQMTDIAKSLREKLAATTTITTGTMIKRGPIPKKFVSN